MNVRARYEEEAESANQARAQLSKLTAELQVLKTKYDREVVLKSEETEEVRRKFTLRITELEEITERKSPLCAGFPRKVSSVIFHTLQVPLVRDSRRQMAELSLCYLHYYACGRRFPHSKYAFRPS